MRSSMLALERGRVWSLLRQQDEDADCMISRVILCAQSGLADIRAWVSYMGVGWCGDVADAEAALQHTGQAVRYLLVGKDDCVRKATKVRRATGALPPRGGVLTCGPASAYHLQLDVSATWPAACCCGPASAAKPIC